MAEASLYDLLGVSPTAVPAELKKAYHQQCLRWHPDPDPDPNPNPDPNTNTNTKPNPNPNTNTNTNLRWHPDPDQVAPR